MAAHARLLAARGYPVKIIAGRGKAFHPRVPVALIRDADSQSPRVLRVNAELARGIVSNRFDALVRDLTRALGRALARGDVLFAHNALSLHKNLALTVALKKLAATRSIKLIAWCHDFAWNDPQYQPELHRGFPWELLRQPWPGVKYVVDSEARKKELEEMWSDQSVIPSTFAALSVNSARNPIASNETLRGVYLEERKARNDIAVVPPGIDTCEFFGLTNQVARWARELNLSDAAPLLLLPARLTRRKNVELAIEITAALRQHGLNAKLVVTGPPGPHNPRNAVYLHSLRALRKERGVENAVIFLHEFGRVDDTMRRDLFLLADALLLPSKREGFGIPLLEAGLARLPIFCADIPPFHESARERANYFDLDEAPAEIAEHITDCLANDSAYQMKRSVLEWYAWERIFSERIEPLLGGE